MKTIKVVKRAPKPPAVKSTVGRTAGGDWGAELNEIIDSYMAARDIEGGALYIEGGAEEYKHWYFLEYGTGQYHESAVGEDVKSFIRPKRYKKIRAWVKTGKGKQAMSRKSIWVKKVKKNGRNVTVAAKAGARRKLYAKERKEGAKVGFVTGSGGGGWYRIESKHMTILKGTPTLGYLRYFRAGGAGPFYRRPGVSHPGIRPVAMIRRAREKFKSRVEKALAKAARRPDPRAKGDLTRDHVIDILNDAMEQFLEDVRKYTPENNDPWVPGDKTDPKKHHGPHTPGLKESWGIREVR